MKKSISRTPDAFALHALLCYQSARMKSRISENGEIIRLQEQDRKLWYYPLVFLGHEAMDKAMLTHTLSHYHIEAAIAAEYVQASTYETTNWDKLLELYRQLYELEKSAYILLNIAILHLEKRNYTQVKQYLVQIDPKELEKRAYLFFATYAEYEFAVNNTVTAKGYMEKAIDMTENRYERAFLNRKMVKHLTKSNA